MDINRRVLRRCEGHHAFSWVGNSCYIDSVFWVLFSSPNIRFIQDKILFSHPSPQRLHQIGSCAQGLNDMNERIFLEFQLQFRKIARYFQCGEGSSTCKEFRRLYRKWHSDVRCTRLHSKVAFHLTDQNEAQEFLQFILSLFGMNGNFRVGAVSVQSFYYGVSAVPRSATEFRHIQDRKDRQQSIVWNVPFQRLSHMISKERTMENLLSHTEETWNVSTEHKNCRYNSIRVVHTLQKFADLLVISLERTNPIRQEVYHYKVQVPNTLTDTTGKTLTLFGVICHHGESSSLGHYTAFCRAKDQEWYYYDDLELPVQHVKDWEQKRHMMSTHGVLFFYAKMD